jgi:hypothetical protein
MDPTLHALIAAQYIQDRIAEASSARSAKAVAVRRRFTRKAKRQVVADAKLPATAKWPTVTPS